jgi:hypothetical protein
MPFAEAIQVVCLRTLIQTVTTQCRDGFQIVGHMIPRFQEIARAQLKKERQGNPAAFRSRRQFSNENANDE